MIFARWTTGAESALMGDAHRTAERIRSQARSQQKALAANPHVQMVSRIAGIGLGAFGTPDSSGAGTAKANGWLIPVTTEAIGVGLIVEMAAGSNRLLKSMSHERGMRNLTDAASHSQ